MSVNTENMDPKKWKKTIDFLKKLPPPVIERRDACYHEHMSKVDKNDFLYICDNCGQICEIVGSFMYWPEQYLKKVATVVDHILKNNPDVLEGKK